MSIDSIKATHAGGSLFDSIGTFTGNMVSIIDLFKLSIAIFSAIIAIAFILFFWRRRINEITRKKIDILKQTGKYIDGIYIELNNTKELLRYYLHGLKWKSKIIIQYNRLFKAYNGKLAKDNILKNLKFKITNNINMFELENCIDNMYDFMKNIRSTLKDEDLKSDKGDLRYYIKGSFYEYDDCLLELKKQIEMMSAKQVVILGNAGNGKTNLLSNFAETVMKYKQPCIFINAKEIKGDLENLILKEFCIPKRMNKDFFLGFYSKLLSLQKKNLYIIIDAINENDEKDFRSNIVDFLNTMGKYDKIKILISCRNEYFNERFEKLFDGLNKPLHYMTIDAIKYETRAKEKLLYTYQKYFKVKGNIVGSAKEKIFKSLFLMRLFFEVNSEKTINTLELRNAEIYKLYIEKISEQARDKNNSFDFERILMRIVEIMLEDNSYDGIKIDRLKLNDKDLDILKYVLDENLIISRKVTSGIGITEKETENIYFVFDELRDFCIARYILIKCDNENQMEYRTLFEVITRLYEEKLSPLEGVLKYAYYYLKNQSINVNRLDICEEILNKYGNATQNAKWKSKQDTFDDFGILMIIADCSSLEEFEFNYIVGRMSYIRDFWRILNILFDNEIANIGLFTDVFIKIILSYPLETIQDIICKMTKEDYFGKAKDLEKFIFKVLRQDEISNEIKWILMLMKGMIQWNENLEKCFEKFDINNNDKRAFKDWLEDWLLVEDYPEIEGILHIIEC